MLCSLLASAVAVWSTQNYLWRFPGQHKDAGLRAVLVDGLSQTYPDPSFVTNTTEALKTGGYTLDYLGPQQATVDSYRLLPSMGYDLIIIRTHTASDQSIITTDTYDKSRYVYEQITGSLAPSEVLNGPPYFAITPQFIRHQMQGRFQDSVVIVMGCGAMEGTHQLAEAFLDLGARYFIGWDGSVTIVHTDTSIVALAQWIAKGRSPPDAVSLAGTPDPVYNAKLEALDWSTLVQQRVNGIVSGVAVWAVLAGILVLGPLAVFLAPAFLNAITRPKRHSKPTRETHENSPRDG